MEEQGWDTSILPEVERVAAEALKSRADDVERAREGLAWMMARTKVHPQFNTVEEGEC